MKLIRKRGDTSNILQIFVRDSSSTTGAGLTGLAFNTASLVAYFHRDVDTTATAITLVTMTVGTFTSSGFKEIDATNMPGWYQFCPPDTAFAATSTPKSVAFHLKGATNMAPLPLECQLIAADVEDATALGLSRIDAAVTSRLAPTVAARTLDVSAGGEAGLDWANIGSPTTVVGLSGTTVLASTTAVNLTTNNDKTGYTVAAGGIGSGAIAAAEKNNIADACLDRRLDVGTDSSADTTTGRTWRSALRTLRNKVAVVAGTATTYKEDDATASHTAAITTTAGNPISTIDPT